MAGSVNQLSVPQLPYPGVAGRISGAAGIGICGVTATVTTDVRLTLGSAPASGPRPLIPALNAHVGVRPVHLALVADVRQLARLIGRARARSAVGSAASMAAIRLATLDRAVLLDRLFLGQALAVHQQLDRVREVVVQLERIGVVAVRAGEIDRHLRPRDPEARGPSATAGSGPASDGSPATGQAPI